MTKVSVCMMVRNEEPILGRALSSVLGLADEIVIVDTGSTDGTLKVAKEFGARVIEGGDRRHKAAARNQAMEAATGDWVVILDADEVISDPAGVRAFLESTSATAVYIRETFMDGGDQPTLSFAQMRMWRRGAYQYHFRAHEVPLPVGDWGEILRTDFRWEHRPPAGRTWKREHMLMLLLMDVDENPGQPRPLYYLSREYMYLGAWQACIDISQQFLAVSTDADHERAEAFGNLATCYFNLRQQEKGREWLHRAMAAQPESRAWPCLLAEHFHAIGQHNQAIGYLSLALSLPKPAVGYVDERWYGAYPYDLLARCYWYAGRKAEGLPFARKACEMAPDDVRLRANLAWFEGDHGTT